ncbi:MAG: hypothetical protein RBT62_02960 [Spirochaetia bacterium]|jgi:hypothetical protein|nr:hypothetical protein [Spirochaetia bacterium]
MRRNSFVFILGSKKPLVFHPFDGSEIFESLETGSILGRYGSGDTPRDADSIRKSLYIAMEKGSRRYFLNKGYYLRLALTAGTFVVVYLFFSIVIRDPVPLIDELLLGTLAAAAVFFASERKALSSPAHVEVLLRLRRAIDGAYFSESRIVDLLESWKDEALALGPAAFYKNDSTPAVLNSDERTEARALCAVLAKRWKTRPIVAELYDASTDGRAIGDLLDKAARKLGNDECALALAYLRLIPLATEVEP